MAAISLPPAEDDVGEEGVEDMINLLSLTETNLLKNIRYRYEKQLIYTYTGSILVAVNPYKMFNVYGLPVVKQYEDAVLGDQPPHLFAIGSASFQKMNKDLENQAIIISGESGAGKTESTKLLMQYLAAVNKSGTSIVTERILEANPLLESFGNAKTIRNDNSSRFGKYVELYFKGGSIVGAKTSEYLLEKSRIVSQASDERNYHVFYELLAGLTTDEKIVYGLSEPAKYFYLNQGGSCAIASKNDEKDFKNLRSAMEVLAFKKQEQEMIYKILAAVLHLGNIYFTHEPNEFQHEGVTIATEGSDAETKWVCHLLQLDEDWLREALTKKVTEARQERMVTPLNTLQAQDARDAVAKALYQRLFTWLVERVNEIVHGPDTKDAHSQRDRIVSIAILDIFGFEDFRTNSFEQLCINYANESLQFYFNKHIFRLEQQEYAKERINWTTISFHDNQPTIDLISKKPHGIIHVLDDESNFPKGTDQSFLEKCHFTHTNDTLYEKPRMSALEFSIKHYAGKVTYNVRNFLDKNRDTLRADVVQLLIQSKNPFISKMFQELRDSVVTKTISKMSGLYVTMKPKTPTVAASFHESLLSLIDSMAKCNPWFVRCIKPNNYKSAMMFEQDVVLTQLQYTGMLQTITIRKMGFPVRHRFKLFIEKYFVLLPHNQRRQLARDDRVICDRILRHLGDDLDKSWQLGLTKVFLKEKLGYELDSMRTKVINEAVVKVQRFARGFTARRRYQRKRGAAITIQAGLRRWLQRSRYLVIRQGVIRAQAQYRMYIQRRKYLEMLEEQKRKSRDEIQRRREEKRVNEARLMRKREESLRQHQNEAGMSRMSSLEVLNKPGAKKSKKNMPGIHAVAQLEIPRELANIFRQLQVHYPIHSEEHNILQISGLSPTRLNLAMPDDINSYAFSKYVNVYFHDHEWSMKKEVISKPFLKDSDTRDATAIFRLIMRYMYDSNQSDRQAQLIGSYIIQKGLNNVHLQDEIYAQLANQTWLNKDDQAKERGWMLMAACLSCFPPSNKINKYLLKYVSDHGFRSYKVCCQHKLLQCLLMSPEQKRTYPPCLLEWKANKEKGCMALQGNFSDGGDPKVCHMESWTTAEECASYLLQLRDIKDGHHGWTILLRDENDTYEYAGYDYMMDLISEMELEPDFPHSFSYYITGSRKRSDGSSVRRDVKEHPHNTENARILELSDLGIQELLNPSPTEPRPGLDPQGYFKYNSLSSNQGADNPYTAREEMLSQSKLNQRKPELDPSLSTNSILNIRYTKRPAPPPPSSEASTLTGDDVIQNGQSESPFLQPDLSIAPESKLNRRYVQPKNKMPANLAHTKLNTRYTNGHVPTDNIPNGHVPNGRVNGHHGNTARDKIMRKKRSSEAVRYHPSEGSEAGSVKSSADMDQWVDKLFSPVLTGNLDDLVDARSLEHKIKGGADIAQPSYHGGLYQSGFTSQPSMFSIPAPQPSVLINTTIPATQGAIPLGTTPHIPAPGVSFVTHDTGYTAPVLSTPIVPMQLDPLQQLAQQQLAQQRQQQQQQQLVQQQAAAAAQEALRSQQLQQQQLQQQQLQQQTASLHVQLQQQQLHTQILQQSVQSEILKRQLKELQDQEEDVSPPRTSSSSSPYSPRRVQSYKHSVAIPPRDEKVSAQGLVDSSRPGGVQTLKRAYENKVPVNDDVFMPPEQTTPSTSSPKDRGVLFSDVVHTIPRTVLKETGTSPPPSPIATVSPQAVSPHQAASPPPPPPPPLELMASALHQTRSPLLPPPPLPSPPISLTQRSSTSDSPEAIHNIFTEIVANQENQNVSLQSSSSDNTTKSVNKCTIIDEVIKIGKIQWPPPVEEKTVRKVQVGKLRIQERDDLDQEPVSPHKSPEVPSKIRVIEKSQHLPPGDVKPKPPTNQHKKVTEPVGPPPEERVTINMKERQEAMERKLSNIFNTEKLKQEPKRAPLSLPLSPPPVQEMPVQKPKPKPAPLILPPPVLPDLEISDEPDTPVDIQALEQVHTHLYKQNNGPFFIYNRVNWSLEVRKELFTPHEKIELLHPLLIKLIFAQIVQDVTTNISIRINKDVRLRAKRMMDTFSITTRNMLTIDPQVQLRVIEEAREWPCYFSRIFAATGGRRHPRVNYVSVSHAGVFLLDREKDLVHDTLDVLEHHRFENIMSVSIPQPYTVQIQVSQYKFIIVYTHKANELRSLVDAFCIECEKTEMYVRAKKSYPTRESTLLSFEKGDVIKLTNRNTTMDRGWLYGSIHGRAGLFPRDHIEAMPIYQVQQKAVEDKPRTPREQMDYPSRGGSVDSRTSGFMVPDGTLTMLEFAMSYFRKSPYRYTMARGEGGSIRGTFTQISSNKLHSIERRARKKRSSAQRDDWTWKEQVDMIKWSRSPIQISLLELNKEHNKIALECFISIMRYMGDYPLGKDMRTVDCVLFILMQCHNRRNLVDEIFCQIIKQITNNRSTKSDSETMGWRMLAILIAFFEVTDKLQPYLFKFLESAAYDNSRSSQVLASLCLENARKTIRYGGRKNVPSKVELDAITRGRISKRQVCVLPGGAPVLLNIKSSNVVGDMLEQICINLEMSDPLEREEYTIFYVIEKENHYCPLSPKEYIFDITTELENQHKEFYLLFQRTSWIFPLRLEHRNLMYIDVLYHQCIPDYLDGYMLSIPNKTLPQMLKDEISLLGALLLRIMEKKGTPNQKDTSAVIPQNVQQLSDVKLSNWTNQIHHRLFEVIDISPEEAKVRFLEKLQAWPLFGSTFFHVKGVTDKRVLGECRLAINKNGINCLNTRTNETLVQFPLQQIISTRQTTTDKRRHLDIKIGDLMQHKVIQIDADQSSDIAALINQYIILSKEKLNR